MVKKIKINFILPFRAKHPSGGFKMMYEYANRLTQIGYSVHIYYPIKTPFMKYRFPYFVRLLMSKTTGLKKYNWFQFDPRVTMSYISKVKNSTIDDADIVIATWWATALEMGKLNSNKGKKINLIQGFENWEGYENLLFQSYNMPNTTNVVVATYLKNCVQQYTSKEAVLITNAVDDDEYYLYKPIDERKPSSLCMLYSEKEIKGAKYGLEALIQVKKEHPNLSVDLFGTCKKPLNLPKWINYHCDKRNLIDIYNQNSIFISNSFTEGMALTPLEAAFCGCALICTAIEGHQEYAIDGKTAILVETANSQMLADKISYLIENNDERIELAQRGNDFAQGFSWDLTLAKMDNLIQKLAIDTTNV